MNKFDMLNEIMKEFSSLIQKKYCSDIPLDKWRVGNNYIGHKSTKKQQDIIKALWKESSDFLYLSVSYMDKEKKVAMIQDFIELLNQRGLTCVIEANGTCYAVGNKEVSGQLLELIDAFSKIGKPENMLRMKSVPLLDNDDPRIQLKARGKTLLCFRTKADIESHSITKRNMSKTISEYKEEVFQEVKKVFQDAQYYLKRKIISQGVEITFHVKEAVDENTIIYRHRVDDQKWESSTLLEIDMITKEIVSKVRNERLRNLFN